MRHGAGQLVSRGSKPHVVVSVVVVGDSRAGDGRRVDADWCGGSGTRAISDLIRTSNLLAGPHILVIVIRATL